MPFTGLFPLGRLSALVARLRAVKDAMFTKYLVLTNVSISVTLSGLGDAIQQYYSIAKGDRKDWNVSRTQHMATSGGTVGVLCHHWYNYLDKKLPGRTAKIVIKKVVVDQICFSPVCISVFFLTVGLLERSTLRAIGEEIVEKGKYLYTAEWVVWPPAQVINFYFLPTRYRVLYDNTISLGYDIYTSHVKHELKTS